MWLARLTKPLRQPESNLNTIPFFWMKFIPPSQNVLYYTYIILYIPIYYIRCGNGTQQSDNDKTCLRGQTCSTSSYRHPLNLTYCPLTVDHCPLTVDCWPLTIDYSPLTVDCWLLTVTLDPWPLTVDCWLLTVDRWPLTVDCCPLERKWKKYVTEYLSVMKKVVLLHADYYHDEPQKGSDSLWKGVSSIGLERCLKRKQGDKL